MPSQPPSERNCSSVRWWCGTAFKCQLRFLGETKLRVSFSIDLTSRCTVLCTVHVSRTTLQRLQIVLLTNMMDFITGGGLANALAPRLEVGQEALHDALRSRDSRRAVRIIEKVASNNLGRRRGSFRAIADQRDEEVRGYLLTHRGATLMIAIIKLVMGSTSAVHRRIGPLLCSSATRCCHSQHLFHPSA